MSILHILPQTMRKELRQTIRPFRQWWPGGDPLVNRYELAKSARALDLIEVGVVLVKDERALFDDEQIFQYINSVDAMDAGCITVFERDR